MRYFIRYNPTKTFVQKLYRLDGERLQYYGEQGGWHASGLNLGDFISSETTERVTEAEIFEYIKKSKQGG